MIDDPKDLILFLRRFAHYMSEERRERILLPELERSLIVIETSARAAANALEDVT